MRIINLLFLYRDAHTGSVTEQEAKWRSTIKEKEEAAEVAKAKLTKVTSLPKVHQPLTHLLSHPSLTSCSPLILLTPISSIKF